MPASEAAAWMRRAENAVAGLYDEVIDYLSSPRSWNPKP